MVVETQSVSFEYSTGGGACACISLAKFFRLTSPEEAEK
jgi:hypothetical protein